MNRKLLSQISLNYRFRKAFHLVCLLSIVSSSFILSGCATERVPLVPSQPVLSKAEPNTTAPTGETVSVPNEKVISSDGLTALEDDSKKKIVKKLKGTIPGSGSSCQFSLLGLVPLSEPASTQEAVNRAKYDTGSVTLTNVTVKESYYYFIIGSNECVSVRGLGVRYADMKK